MRSGNSHAPERTPWRASLTGGTEYATQLTLRGAQAVVRPAARQVAAGQGAPPIADIADYRPGGRIATSGAPYRAVPASACRAGVWTPAVGEVVTGTVYVPCGVTLTGTRTLAATVVAEGSVRLTGSNIVITSPADGSPAIVSGATGDAVVVDGAGVRLSGGVQAARGTVRTAGSNTVLECGIMASKITIQGARISAPMAARCLT